MSNKHKPTGSLSLNGNSFASQIVDFVTRLDTKVGQGDEKVGNRFPKNFKFPENFKKMIAFPVRYWLLMVIFIIAAVIILAVTKLPNYRANSNAVSNLIPQGSADINKQFNFPVRGADGKEIGSALPIKITSVERANKVILNGRVFNAKDGRNFLTMNMEIDNKTNNQLTVKPVDFVRLEGSDGRYYAAEFLTAPIKVEPISVKRTRIVFMTDEGQKKLKFLVGEISGSKENLEITI